MANSTPFEVNVSGTDDETFVFSVEWEMDDEEGAFPFEEYAIEYAVMRDRAVLLRMTVGAGITIEDPVLEFRAPAGSLRPGQYDHGCRIRNLDNGDEFQVFDGRVTITEGAFR